MTWCKRMPALFPKCPRDLSAGSIFIFNLRQGKQSAYVDQSSFTVVSLIHACCRSESHFTENSPSIVIIQIYPDERERLRELDRHFNHTIPAGRFYWRISLVMVRQGYVYMIPFHIQKVPFNIRCTIYAYSHITRFAVEAEYLVIVWRKACGSLYIPLTNNARRNGQIMIFRVTAPIPGSHPLLNFVRCRSFI